ncbi:lysosomal aspartic protease-like isoform X2 [Periplaneta americana]|uniref:lysosomal aspartic protease-like isoform X2 n=1 Tax=Periplaneta americana TaxID=6978 RepID=UPI0037E703B2
MSRFVACLTIAAVLATAAEGLSRLPLQRIGRPNRDRRLILARNGNAVPLSDPQYVATINLGTPGQAIRVVLDTGSSDFWVPSSEICSYSYDCSNHNVFNGAESSTFQKQDQPFKVPYGSGTVKGMCSSDILKIPGLPFINITFGLVTKEGSDILHDSNMDGILGLSYLAVSTVNPSDALTNCINQPFYSFYIGQDGGEVIFGGTDSKYYQGDITYVQLLSTSLFQVSVPRLSIGDQNINNEYQVGIVDTGTTSLVMTQDACNQVYKIMQPNCNLLVSPTDQLYLILGLPFLRKYYTVFDMANQRVGFATAVQT